jgi:hypothetical protein
MIFNSFEIPINLTAFIKKAFIVDIGEKTMVREKEVIGDNRYIVELSLEDLLAYSKEVIPFNEIPLNINNPRLFEIIRFSLYKRLELGE